MQTPKFLQNLKFRFLTTGLTTAGTVGLSGYLATLAQSQTPQSIEATAVTFAAGVFMASAPKLLDVILGVTSNIISSDLYDKFTKQEIYKQIPPEANLYSATYTAFQSILNEVVQEEEKRADKKQIKKLRDIIYQSWLDLVTLDEREDDVSAVAKEVLGKFKDENLIKNQFLQSKTQPQKDLLSRQDWLVLLLRLQGKEQIHLTTDLDNKILDALEKDYTTRLRSVFSAHRETFQEITLQLWKTLFGKLDRIEGKIDQILDEKSSKTIKPKPRGFRNKPREKNDYFVEQSNIFTRLDAELAAHHLAYLHGTHGLGKTTTLVEYAFAREKDYDFIIYILATDASIETEMARLADEFLENVAAEDTPAIKALKFKLYLEENERWAKEGKNWLVIFDNLESAARISQYFPKTTKGDCLYACNEKLFVGNDREVNFEQFSPEEAEVFVYQRLNDASEKQREDISAGDLAEINKLVARLGRLPLALNIATAYLIETGVSIDDYLELLRTNVQKFLKYKDEHKASHHETAFEAFLITLDKISNFKGEDADDEIIGKLAETFLNLLIFCAPEDIPEELIKDTLFQTVDTSAAEEPSNILFRRTVTLLKKYGLVKEKEKPFKYKEEFAEPKTMADRTTAHWEEKETVIKLFDTYRALQDILSVKLETEAKKYLLEQMLIVFNGLLPSVKMTTWEIYGKYAAHAFPIAEQAEKLAISNKNSWRVCNQIGFYFDDIAKYRKAEYFYLRGKTIAEDFYGKEHESASTSYNNLAILYYSQSRYEEAEPLYKQALAISEKILGEDYPSTAIRYNNLAELYRIQSRYEEAEPLYKKAIDIFEEVLGENHLNTATSYNNLAALYNSQGRYEEAEPLYRQALSIREKVSGENHLNTAQSYNNLALLCDLQGRYEEAEPLYKQALAIFERVLGKNHPNTAQSYNNLALLYYSQSKYEEAEPLYKQALTIREKVLGENHPSTAESYVNLGALYYKRGQSQDGLELCERALKIYRKALRAGHPDIQNCEDWVEIIKNSMGE